MSEFSSTDKKIIEATFGILQSEGFAKATTKRIAAEAGVNEVTIFRNFKNKKNLVEVTKEYYLQILLDKLGEVFDFNEDDEIEDYLQSNFIGLLNLPESDFSVIKVAMEEVRDGPDTKRLITRVTSSIIAKLNEFFKSQIEKGNVREVDSMVLAVMCFSLTFQSVVLWKIYDMDSSIENERYGEVFLDIFYNGIKP